MSAAVQLLLRLFHGEVNSDGAVSFKKTVDFCSASSFGDKIIDEVAAYIAQENPNIKGFNRRGLYRMKQFYETYKDDEFVTPLMTQISWTNHLLIMSGSKTAD